MDESGVTESEVDENKEPLVDHGTNTIGKNIKEKIKQTGAKVISS